MTNWDIDTWKFSVQSPYSFSHEDVLYQKYETCSKKPSCYTEKCNRFKSTIMEQEFATMEHPTPKEHRGALEKAFRSAAIESATLEQLMRQ